MDKETRKEFAVKHKLTIKKVMEIFKLLAEIGSTKQKLYALCKKLFDLVTELEDGKSIIIDAFILSGFSETQAVGRVNRLLEFGSGELKEEFFGLPEGLIHKVRNFSVDNIKDLLENPKVTVVTMAENGSFTQVRTHWHDLTPTEMNQVFTPKGRWKDEEEQQAKLMRTNCRENGKVVRGQIHMPGGYTTVEKLVEALTKVCLAETTAIKSDKHVILVGKCLTKIKQHNDELHKQERDARGEFLKKQAKRK